MGNVRRPVVYHRPRNGGPEGPEAVAKHRAAGRARRVSFRPSIRSPAWARTRRRSRPPLPPGRIGLIPGLSGNSRGAGERATIYRTRAFRIPRAALLTSAAIFRTDAHHSPRRHPLRRAAEPVIRAPVPFDDLMEDAMLLPACVCERLEFERMRPAQAPPATDVREVGGYARRCHVQHVRTGADRRMGSGGGQRCPDAVVRRRRDHGHRHLYVYRAADVAGPAGQPALWEMLFLSDAKDATALAGKHVVRSLERRCRDGRGHRCRRPATGNGPGQGIREYRRCAGPRREYPARLRFDRHQRIRVRRSAFPSSNPAGASDRSLATRESCSRP